MSTGVEVVVERLTKSFGRSTVWSDVTLTLPPGEISVLLGPSGTGKSVPPPLSASGVEPSGMDALIAPLLAAPQRGGSR